MMTVIKVILMSKTSPLNRRRKSMISLRTVENRNQRVRMTSNPEIHKAEIHQEMTERSHKEMMILMIVNLIVWMMIALDLKTFHLQIQRIVIILTQAEMIRPPKRNLKTKSQMHLNSSLLKNLQRSKTVTTMKRRFSREEI